MKKYTTSERLKQIMSEQNLRQVDILEKAKPLCMKYKVKLGRNDLSQYISGKVKPRQNKLFVLANALNVNEAWLMGYDVSPDRSPSPADKLSQTIAELVETINTHDSNLHKLINIKNTDALYELLLGKLEPAENDGLEENVVIYHRNGETHHRKLSKKEMDMFAKMMEAFSDTDCDL